MNLINLTNLINELKINGYKVTKQRKVILEVLISNKDSMLSVEDLTNESKEIYDKINTSTVYRNLERLEELEFLCIASGDDGSSLYKLISSSKHHHHMICKTCGKTESIYFCPLNIFEEISKEKNFHLTDHKIELYGYCSDCKNKKQ